MPNMSTVAKTIAFTLEKIMDITHGMFIKMSLNWP